MLHNTSDHQTGARVHQLSKIVEPVSAICPYLSLQ